MMHLFLTGPRGCGKSTLLQEVLLPHQKQLAGLSVQRMLENGRLAGFRAMLLEGMIPPVEAANDPEMDGIFILRGKKDVSVLERVITEVEKAATHPACRMILLDEIGGIELGSPLFMATLLRILSGPKPCIGVLKAQENLAHEAARLNLPSSYMALRKQPEDTILACGRLIPWDDADNVRETFINDHKSYEVLQSAELAWQIGELHRIAHLHIPQHPQVRTVPVTKDCAD